VDGVAKHDEVVDGVTTGIENYCRRLPPSRVQPGGSYWNYVSKDEELTCDEDTA